MAQHECPSCGQVHTEKPISLKSRVEILEEQVRALQARMPYFTWTTTPTYFETTADSGSGNVQVDNS